MKLRALATLLFGAAVLVITLILTLALPAAAQDRSGRVQRITARLQPGASHGYLLEDLRAGDRLTIAMRATSGDLDPAIGILDGSVPLGETLSKYRADIQALVAGSQSVEAGLTELRNQTFLAWDDDSGEGYAAALEYVLPKAGDYVLIAGSSLSAFGRTTAGDYVLVIGLNAPEARDPATQTVGAAIAAPISLTSGPLSSVEEITGTLTANTPLASLRLVDIDAGSTLTAYAEATSGNLVPQLILRDYGGKALEAGNLGGEEPQATIQHTMDDTAVGYTLDVRGAPLPDGSMPEGNYRVLVGVNAPDVLTGQAQPQGNNVLKAAIEVQTGLRILRISAVDSPNENYTVLGSLRMDWTDRELAFSPDSCNCSVKLYTDKEFDRFLADVKSMWPAFSFFNQLGNRWIQSRTAAIWPDGRVRYVENFNTTFQADFDFRKYPFDIQTFPIYLDLIYPTTRYTMVDLPGYSGIDPAHGEDEFIVSDLTATPSTEMPSAADFPASRMTFSFSAPRHLNYYILQVFLPITLIILISWFTFFLKDYSRRIEAATGNILLFIAFSFSLAGDFPRLGYITFLGAVMAVTFGVNVLVLLYNVRMKQLEGQGKAAGVERVDNVLDWLYPLMYIALIGVMAVVFL